MTPGGQLTTTTDVENYPGFPEGINGYDLVENMKQQAEKYGTQVYDERVNKVDFSIKPFRLTSASYEIESDTVIIATGATANKLYFEGSEEYWNKGISACAVCDGACPIFSDKPLVVIGGGDSAMEEAIFLTKYGSKVYIIHRRDKLRASKYMQQKAKLNDKIKFLYSCEVTEAKGNGEILTDIVIKNNKDDTTGELKCNGLFYGIGHTPTTEIFKDYIILDNKEYIKTKDNSTATNVEGVFACGDVQDSKWRQAITAAGTGCMAALEVEHYLNG